MEALNIQLSPFFQWLLKTSLQGSLLICLILLVKSVLRGKLPIRWHYYLWLLLLVRLALPWAPQSRLSIFNLIPQYSSPERAETALTTGSTGDAEALTTANSETTRDTAEQTMVEQQTVQPESATPEPGLTSTSAPVVPEAASPDRSDSTRPVSIWIVRILPLAWLLGAIALGGFVAVRNFNLWRAIKRERPVTDSEILELLEDCKMQMNVQTIVGVIVTDRVKSPALFGFVRPRLLLPQGLIEALDLEELHYVFLHELAHLKRRDIYLGWLVSLLQVMHWFNPLIWFALRRMRIDQELACDGLALSTMKADEPPKYGRTIVNLFEKFSQVSYVPSIAGILEEPSQLERRIKMIANPERKSRTQSVGAMFLLVALSCVALTDARPAHSTVDSLDMKVPASLHRNVLLYLSFDRDGGTRAVDISGMDFHGELHGCEHIEDGRIGGAMRFDGDHDHISISGVKLHAFTFSAWVKTNTEDLNNRRLFLLDSGEQYYAVQGTSRCDVELSGAGFEGDDPEPIPMREFVVNDWTYVTTTFDGDLFRVYKNGVLARSGRNVHGGLTGTAYLGGTDKYRGGFWSGLMDEVAIFNRALTANEIKRLYNMAGGMITPLFDTTSAIDSDGQGLARFEGVWSGLAVDKPGYGTSRDSLTLELSADGSGRLAGIATGNFVNSGYCRLKNVEVSGNRITFEVRHRFRNMRVGVTLELKDGTLQGEGVPIDMDDDQCDITLRRDSKRTNIRSRPEPHTTATSRSGPVLHYSFDGSQGLIVNDESGQGHHGSVYGASYESNGRVGGAMSFDGDDDHIRTSDISLREFTFSAWLKTHTGGLNNRRIFLLSDGENCYALQCNVGGSVGIYVADDVEVNEYDWSFQLGKWTHVTVTHDGSIFKIYKDGRLTEIGHIKTSGVTGTLYIGGTDRHRGGFWHGMIDELFIFNRALSDSEIERFYGSAAGAGDVYLPARRTDEPVTTGEYAPGSRFEGVWSGMAGIASGEFVKGGHCELKNLKLSGIEHLLSVSGLFSEEPAG